MVLFTHKYSNFTMFSSFLLFLWQRIQPFTTTPPSLTYMCTCTHLSHAMVLLLISLALKLVHLLNQSFHLIFSVSLFPLPLFFSSLSQLPLALFHSYALLVSDLRFHLHTHKSHSYSTCALSHTLKWVGTQAETCKSAGSTHVNAIYTLVYAPWTCTCTCTLVLMCTVGDHRCKQCSHSDSYYTGMV